jgi:hypothetical protein
LHPVCASGELIGKKKRMPSVFASTETDSILFLPKIRFDFMDVIGATKVEKQQKIRFYSALQRVKISSKNSINLF